MKIIFMGTPDFAVPCLKKLISDGHSVEAVFTREDKPVGRKHILTAPPVKVAALAHNIPVFQPKKLRDNNEVLELIKNINPDMIVVVAYGRILTKEILDIPKYGCVNVHGSLLPKYRGSAPIQWSVINGDKETGVTTMLTRFPGGSSNLVSAFNPGIMSRLANALTEKGFRYFDWNVTSGDAGETTSTTQVVKNVINGMASHSVSVVLQHDIKNFSVDAVEQIIQWGQANGYTFKACDMTSPTCHHGINN